MKKETNKKLVLNKIRIAKLSGGRHAELPTTDYPTNVLTCGVCDPVTVTQIGLTRLR